MAKSQEDRFVPLQVVADFMGLKKTVAMRHIRQINETPGKPRIRIHGNGRGQRFYMPSVKRALGAE